MSGQSFIGVDGAPVLQAPRRSTRASAQAAKIKISAQHASENISGSSWESGLGQTILGASQKAVFDAHMVEPDTPFGEIWDELPNKREYIRRNQLPVLEPRLALPEEFPQNIPQVRGFPPAVAGHVDLAPPQDAGHIQLPSMDDILQPPPLPDAFVPRLEPTAPTYLGLGLPDITGDIPNPQWPVQFLDAQVKPVINAAGLSTIYFNAQKPSINVQSITAIPSSQREIGWSEYLGFTESPNIMNAIHDLNVFQNFFDEATLYAQADINHSLYLGDKTYYTRTQVAANIIQFMPEYLNTLKAYKIEFYRLKGEGHRALKQNPKLHEQPRNFGTFDLISIGSGVAMGLLGGATGGLALGVVAGSMTLGGAGYFASKYLRETQEAVRQVDVLKQLQEQLTREWESATGKSQADWVAEYMYYHPMEYPTDFFETFNDPLIPELDIPVNLDSFPAAEDVVVEANLPETEAVLVDEYTEVLTDEVKAAVHDLPPPPFVPTAILNEARYKAEWKMLCAILALWFIVGWLKKSKKKDHTKKC